MNQTKTIAFESIYNFRDMGGQLTKDGRQVKESLLFRCGELGHATENDIELLKNLQLQTIFDYREEKEANEGKTPHIEGVENIRIAANNLEEESSSLEGLLHNEMWKKENALGTFYTEMLFGNPAYQELIARIKNKKAPLLHHCTAGKDRTGVGAALIYLLLGVDEKDIIYEYLLTNESTAKHTPKWYSVLKEEMKDHPELFAQVANVKPQYMEMVFAKIREHYSDYDTYFKEQFGLSGEDINDIREFYLV
ncbi:tyrosine-protein phosphatase [Bacillus sp. JJ722]|uniref:tyrosine-protein phosphatase n=1 Tax=Bacillus sp. JJ722 TaxID=3122973 RepID=UPI002FFD8187